MADMNSKITLKLLIDARSHKVLFGEAGKDFVDFMFSLLTRPLGSVIKLLSPPTMIGSFGKLYQSVENLNEIYKSSSLLLQPKMSTSYVTNHLLLDTEATFVVPSCSSVELKYYLCNYCNRKVTTVKNILCPNCKQAMLTEATFVVPPVSGVELKYYICSNCNRKVSTVKNTLCPTCKCAMVTEVAFVVPSGSAASFSVGNAVEGIGGFVKGMVTYMITDDLEVTPISAISCTITLMKRFIVKKDVQIEEKVVAVGMEEGLALLKASLNSPTALTDVFCSPKKKANPPSSSIMDDDDIYHNM